MNGLYPTQNYSFDETINLLIAYRQNPLSNSTNPFPITITKPLTESEIILSQFQSNNWEIINRDEIFSFLETNPDVMVHLKEIIAYIPRLINKPFAFKLRLERDPEIEDFETLFLLIVGKFKPKEAFNLLEKIDKKWFLKNNPDVTKFNINIEFQ